VTLAECSVEKLQRPAYQKSMLPSPVDLVPLIGAPAAIDAMLFWLQGVAGWIFEVRKGKVFFVEKENGSNFFAWINSSVLG
jgi:hypothetical protein